MKANVSITSSMEKIRVALHQDFPEVDKLRPGEKSMFIRKNLDLILQFNQVFGDDKTMEVFHLRPDTLCSIKNNDGKYSKFIPANMTTKLRSELALELFTGIEKRLDHLAVRTEDITSLRREVRELKAEFGRFAEVTADRVVKALITPLLQSLLAEYNSKYNEDGEEVEEEITEEITITNRVMSSRHKVECAPDKQGSRLRQQSRPKMSRVASECRKPNGQFNYNR